MRQNYNLTLEQATRERAVILATLNSHEHYAATPTLAYGQANPFFVQLVCCVCGSMPDYISHGDVPRVVWKVQCSCGESTRQVQHKWQAALAWNIHNVRRVSLDDIPFFDIPKDLDAAVTYLSAIRDNLELRLRLALLETYLVRNDLNATLKQLPGAAYKKRLQAYKEWARLAIKIVKYQQYLAKKDKELTEGSHNDNVDSGDY